MGLYNKDQSQMSMKLPVGLQKFLCPFCHEQMISIAWDNLKNVDAYHYKCKKCNPNTIIAISGNMVSDLDNILEKNASFLPNLINKISSHKDEFFEIKREDFPRT